MTSDQMVDVLRAWGEKPWNTAGLGILSALLLGAVMSETALRALSPWKPPTAEDSRTWRSWVVVGVAVIVAIPLLALGAVLGWSSSPRRSS